MNLKREVSGATPTVTVNAVGTETYHTAVTTLNYVGITVAAGSHLALVLTINFGSSTVSGVTAVWDSGGSNQAMTQIVIRQSAQASSVIFGLRNPTAGNKTLLISWTGSSELYVAAVSFAGVNQTSDGAAFPHSNSGINAQTIAITSANGNKVVGCQASGSSQGNTTGTQLYNDHTSGVIINAQGEYDNGAASVTIGSTSGTNATLVAVDVAAG